MDVNLVFNTPKKIRVYLVFFCLLGLMACHHSEVVNDLRIDYEGKKAVGVAFTSDLDVEKLRVFVGESSTVSVIGDIVSFKDEYTFTPAIPFTPGQTYSIRKGDTEVITTFSIAQADRGAAPELLAIYPTCDSVPENLLKIYLKFSKPMQEAGNALDFIRVNNDSDNRVTHPFLKLETELWNKEHTLLTLWFDPGRIKTDLIPNLAQGLPLSAGKVYTLSISDTWKDANGQSLNKAYSKKLHVQQRDDRKPMLEDWELSFLENDPNKILYIDFGESLDAFLARETIKVYDANGLEVMGTFKLRGKEMGLKFIPVKKWPTGEYELRVQSRLEDLAGNNLNRLFDTDRNEATSSDALKADRSIRFKVPSTGRR